MLNALIRKFVPRWEDTGDRETRTAYGVFAGCMGVALNLLLFFVKLPIGLMTGSIAITSDAFNNISDMGSSLITVIGVKMAGRKADREHPFGHGRMEYVAALFVAVIILLVGFELLKESFGKFFSPAAAPVSPVLLGILGLSVAVKLFMYYYNRKIGAAINSPVMRAAASDSINDVYVTAGVVAASILDRFVTWPVDAVAGCLVSLMILWSGWGVARDTVDLLLGGKPDPDLARSIALLLQKDEGISGIHDLIVHDYGPGRAMASVHAEVPDDADIIAAHEAIDELEKKVYAELGVPIVIHMDPIAVNNPRVTALRNDAEEVARNVDARFTIHDFRMTQGQKHANLIFDLLVPCEMSEAERSRSVAAIRELLAQDHPDCRCVIQIDDDYANR